MARSNGHKEQRGKGVFMYEYNQCKRDMPWLDPTAVGSTILALENEANMTRSTHFARPKMTRMTDD